MRGSSATRGRYGRDGELYTRAQRLASHDEADKTTDYLATGRKTLKILVSEPVTMVHWSSREEISASQMDAAPLTAMVVGGQ
jgi:hypothetical protein